MLYATDGDERSRRAGAIAERYIPGLQKAAGQIGDSGASGALARGIVFQNAAFLEDAVASFKEALALDPSTHEAGARLVLTLLRARKPEAALDVAMKLAQSAPDYAMPELTTDESIGVFTLLGNALLANGRLSDAGQAYETALRQRPEDSTAAARLAQVHIASGTPERALDHVTSIQKNPRFASLASLLQISREDAGLLSAFAPANAATQIAVDVHGRPYSVSGELRVAVVAGDEAWSNEAIDIRLDS